MNYTKLKVNLENYKIDKTQNNSLNKISENLWIFGKPGCGKTYYATHKYPNFYMKPLNRWWDGYKDQEVVIVDDLDCTNNREIGHLIKVWADNYNALGEIKMGTVNLNFKKLLVTSNYMPRALWPSDRQMQIAICRRFKFISVRGTFPNFIPFDLPNPIETNY